MRGVLCGVRNLAAFVIACALLNGIALAMMGMVR